MTANTLTAANLENLCVQRIDDDIPTKVQGFFRDVAIGYTKSAFLDYIKMNAIGPDGRYSSDTDSNRYDFPGTVPRGTAATGPPQVAWVCTLTTVKNRGHAHVGRFYVPVGDRLVQDDTFLIPPTDATPAAQSVAAFLTALNNAPGLDDENLRVAVQSNVGAGVSEDVTGVKMGRLFDTQRRRRNRLQENYTAVVPVT